MGTPYGRQSMESWQAVRKWDEETTQKLTYRVADGIRYRFPHKGCTHDKCCDDCKSLINRIVEETRKEYEEYLGHKLSELLNIKCPFPHHGD